MQILEGGAAVTDLENMILDRIDDFVEKIKLLHEREKMTMDARIAELLTACKRLVELMDAHGWGEGPARRAAIEAIKKAEVQP